jgi:hypothetical protein
MSSNPTPYQLHYSGTVILRDDGVQIPVDEENWAYQEFLRWDALPGNDPLPAEPQPPRPAQDLADEQTLRQFQHDYQTLKTGIAAIRGDMDQILAGPGTPTPAQTGQALKLTATDLKKMLTGLDVLLDDMEIMVRRLYIPAAPPTAP